MRAAGQPAASGLPCLHTRARAAKRCARAARLELTAASSERVHPRPALAKGSSGRGLRAAAPPALAEGRRRRGAACARSCGCVGAQNGTLRGRRLPRGCSDVMLSQPRDKPFPAAAVVCHACTHGCSGPGPHRSRPLAIPKQPKSVKEATWLEPPRHGRSVGGMKSISWQIRKVRACFPEQGWRAAAQA